MNNRALLVGLDEYREPRARLNSCVADTVAFRELLRSYGFEDANVRFLHNRDATLTNVQQALDWLLEGASEGDRRVFFQSSHGCRVNKPDGTKAEVLCLYGFDGRQDYLGDHEFSLRTQQVPPTVLTVIVDACHSGGMDKVFFVDDDPWAARAKVFPLGENELFGPEKEISFTADAPVSLKFFGRSAASDLGSIAKNLAAIPEVSPTATTPRGDVEINALLFTACRADQTAAAGTPTTKGLSAFTFAITEEQDRTQSVSSLCRRAADRLNRLHMAQTPTLFARPDQQQLLDRTFITAAPAAVEHHLSTAATDPEQARTTTLDSPTNKEETLMNTTVSDAVTAALRPIVDRAGAPASKTLGTADSAYQDDVRTLVQAIAPGLVVAASNTASRKEMPVPTVTISNPADLQTKGFWDDVWAGLHEVLPIVLTIGEKVVPVLVDALTGDTPRAASKDVNPDVIANRLADNIPPERAGDQEFWGTAHSALQTLAPAVISMAEGQPHSASFPAIPPARANDKDWLGDLVGVVGAVLPLVIALL